MKKNSYSLLLSQHKNLLLYIAIGLSGVVIDFIVFLGLIKLGINPILASLVSVSIAIVNNFFWNAYLNFKKTDHLLLRFLVFFSVGTIGTVLGILILFLLHNVFHIDAIYAKLASIPLVVIFQYWFNKSTSFSPDKRSIPWRKMCLTAFIFLTIVFFIIISPFGHFSDEYDNLLGAQIITHGGLIYKDYFSHHMPLTYFIAAPFIAILGTNLIAIKVCFGILFGSWLLLMSRHLYKKFGSLFFYVFVGFISLIQLPGWSQMLLAESFIGLAIVHALILYLTADSRRTPARDIVTYGLLAAITTLSSLSYLPLGVFICMIGIVQVAQQHRKGLRLNTLSVFGAATIALLPYITFVAYLFITKTASMFIDQAITFNSLYYSQFTSQAPHNTIDAVLSITAGSLGNIYAALTFNPFHSNSPIAFVFAIAVLVGIVYLIKVKDYLLASIYTGAVVLSASREGFTSALAQNGSARNGIMLTYVIVLFSAFILWHIYAYKKHVLLPTKLSPLTRNISYLLLSSFIFVGIYAASGTLNSLRLLNNDRAFASLQPPISTGSIDHIINLVTKPEEYYWTGPIDFRSQLFVNRAQNASTYRFYLPWHARCAQCTSQIAQDFAHNRPTVIYFDTTDTIWVHPVSVYADQLIDSFENNYYQLKDPQLKNFYFLKVKSDRINDTLKSAGYNIETIRRNE